MKRILQKRKTWTIAAATGVLLAVIVAAGTVATPAATAAPATAAAPTGEDLASMLRGGRLYDNWFLELRHRAPKTAHPAYPAAGKFAHAPQQNWRCAECHGWDYQGKDGIFSKESEHYTGIKGIRGMFGADPEKVIAILKDESHRFDEHLHDPELQDLAAFVTRGQVDVSQFLDRKTGLSRGNRKRHAAFYETVCTNCHGRSGDEMSETMPLGRFSREDPYETLHKVLYGHPGAKMPAALVLGNELVADTVAYMQELPLEEIQASIVRGGRLYDNWITETHSTPPKAVQPAYPVGRPLSDNPQDTWRCKECHGWDYKGRDGTYGSGDHATGTKGIRASEDASPSSIVMILKDKIHRYDTELSPLNLLDLANFVSKGQVDVDRYIDPKTGKVKGDATKYRSYYDAVCSRCHGVDGAKITTMIPLGTSANKDPWSALHKVLNGHPDQEMTPMRSFDVQVSADIVALLQTLPAR